MKMTLGKCHKVTMAGGSVLRFKVLGGEEVMVKLSNGNTEKLDVLVVKPYDQVKEISCEEAEA